MYKKEFCSVGPIPEAPRYYSFRCIDDTGVSYMLYGDTWRVGVECAGIPGWWMKLNEAWVHINQARGIHVTGIHVTGIHV